MTLKFISNSFAIGRRVSVAAFATTILVASLVSIKVERAHVETAVKVESREDPNFFLAAISLYLLGVATDLDLALPLRMLRGNSKNQEDNPQIYSAQEFEDKKDNSDSGTGDSPT